MPLHYVCGYFWRACVSLYSCVLSPCMPCRGVRCTGAAVLCICVCMCVLGRTYVCSTSWVPLPQLKRNAETRDRTEDLQIFGLTLSQLSYRGLVAWQQRECSRYDIPNKDMDFDFSILAIFLGSSPSFFFAVPRPAPNRTESKARPQPARKQTPALCLLCPGWMGGRLSRQGSLPSKFVYGTAANVSSLCHIFKPLLVLGGPSVR